MNDRYDEFSDLLGAYALDAVDVDERKEIERHLATCPRCRAEVAEHREVAALLSQSGAPAPDGVWDRIASELSPPAPPMRMSVSPSDQPGSTVVALADAPSADRRSVTRRSMVAMLAVAASIIVVLGIVAVAQSTRANRHQSLEALAGRAASSSKLKVDLTGAGGNAQAVVGANGKGYLITDGMAAPAGGHVYQLWGKVGGTVLSLGTFGDSKVVPFSVDPSHIGDIELFAVTQEQAPGVIASTQKVPVMAGTV